MDLLYHSGRGILLLSLVFLWITDPASAQITPNLPAVMISSEPARSSTSRVSEIRLHDLDLHPDLIFQPYITGAYLGNPNTPESRRIQSFRDFLSMYQQRQGEDDNFTVRVLDNRTTKTLEVFVLELDQRRYEETGKADWKVIDGKRRVETKRLIDKHASRGIPRDAISARWGRANEVREARERELPVIEYEIALARYLGLSLLATEIGTVETFNQDRLVSRAGARSRYQMMPNHLKRNKIYRYPLKTLSGRSVSVNEEWHPLLTMEPALNTLRGFINAAGHEIPGISAYHAGAGNIFNIYRLFLSRHRTQAQSSSSVVDAYIWAITDGFPTVSSSSSFKQYSRAYVATVYGSLRALENEPINFIHSVRAERVQLRPGKQISLKNLLNTLEQYEDNLDWGSAAEAKTFYARFRMLNPHMYLPQSIGQGVPENGNIRLVSTVNNMPVRFFLPLGGTAILEEAGQHILDENEIFLFDENTYAPVDESQITTWDRAYEALVDDIKNFGFTHRNRNRLIEIREHFEDLARRNPSHFRTTQLNIIKVHELQWSSAPWESLAQAISQSGPGRR